MKANLRRAKIRKGSFSAPARRNMKVVCIHNRMRTRDDDRLRLQSGDLFGCLLVGLHLALHRCKLCIHTIHNGLLESFRIKDQLFFILHIRVPEFSHLSHDALIEFLILEQSLKSFH